MSEYKNRNGEDDCWNKTNYIFKATTHKPPTIYADSTTPFAELGLQCMLLTSPDYATSTFQIAHGVSTKQETWLQRLTTLWTRIFKTIAWFHHFSMKVCSSRVIGYTVLPCLSVSWEEYFFELHILWQKFESPAIHSHIAKRKTAWEHSNYPSTHLFRVEAWRLTLLKLKVYLYQIIIRQTST